jgi:benzodiazapine receptor
MMAVSAWLVWRQAGLASAKLPLVLFAIQLVLNSLWSVLFFGLHSPGMAAVEIVILWLAIVATMVAFFRCSKIAGWLMVPYLAWVSFAAVLNFTVWQLNA